MCRCHPLWIVHRGKIPFRYNYYSCSRPPTNYAGNQSIHHFKRKKKYLKIICQAPLILKKTHSHATQAFVSYDLVLFRSHSVTKTAATRAECEVSGPWRWRLAWRFRTVWTGLFPSCHLVSLLSSARLGSTHGVSNSGPACIFVHPWCITNESPAWTNGSVKKEKKKKNSLRTTHSLSLAPRQRDGLTAKLTNCHHLWW